MKNTMNIKDMVNVLRRFAREFPAHITKELIGNTMFPNMSKHDLFIRIKVASAFYKLNIAK